jgi:DNA adenine methylase
LTAGGRYVELFAGSAAVFFELEPKRAVLVDICKPLMAFYEAVKKSPASVSDELEVLVSLPHGEKTYNQIKSEWNGNDFGVKFAARLLYLNRLGFNGLFRLNHEGGFNVAWGKSAKMPGLPSREDIKKASDLLAGSMLYAQDYAYILRATHAGDVVYADPPYWGCFDRYAGGQFPNAEHHRLAERLRKAVLRGVSVFASNIDCPEVQATYNGWANIDPLPVLHKIGASANCRKVVNEVVISAVAPYGNPRQLSLFAGLPNV